MLKEFDRDVLLQITMKGEKGDNVPLDIEKEFLVMELRRLQNGRVDMTLGKKDVEAIIVKGLSAKPPKLAKRGDVSDTFYYGVVKRFLDKFLKVCAQLAAEP